MVNRKTIRGLYAAFKEHVPGRAQRDRLLKALLRVTGNAAIEDAVAQLCVMDLESGPVRKQPAPPAPTPGVKASLVRYTQSPAEVDVRMDRATTEAVVRALSSFAPDDRMSTSDPVALAYRAMKETLKQAA